MKFSVIDYSIHFEPTVLDSINDELSVIASTEGWGDVFKNFVTKFRAVCGSQEAMAKYIDDNKEKFRNLFKDIYVRTVMPADLKKAQEALNILTEKLGTTRAGEYAKFDDSDIKALEEAGVEVREDGDLYDNKFKTGNWGYGINQSALKGPMTFKKKIGEFKWEQMAPSIAEDFVEAVRKIDSKRMEASLAHHFKDRSDAVKTVQQKGDVRTDKQVSWNQSINLLQVREHLIKFIYGQLKTVLRFAKENDDGSAKAADPNQKYYA